MSPPAEPALLIASKLPAESALPAEPTPRDTPRIARSDPAFWRLTAPLAFGGFSTFALLYNVQPLLPLFSRAFAISPASAALAVSVSTIVLSVSMIGAGIVADLWGRKTVMATSIALSSLAILLGAAAPNWPSFLALRALAGLTLAGLPAVAMAYLVDELDFKAVGFGMGLYIAGTTLGGMSGRLVAAAISEYWGWRMAVAAAGLLGSIGALWIAFALPPSRHAPRGASFSQLWPGFAQALADPGLRLLFAEGFLVMGVFVCSYNYIGFRLAAPPFSLSQTVIGSVFVLYLIGAVSSAVMGQLADRFGRRRVLWIAIAAELAGVLATLPNNLVVVIVGVALITWGFFGAHTVASSWVGLRAPGARPQAAALYLFFYYIGSSLIGWLGGLFFARGGWAAVVALLAGLSAAGLVVALRLSTIPPPRPRANP
jgi:YNFM family putative membrane transporter